VIEGSKEGIREFILRRVVSNFGAIFKQDCLLADNAEVDRVNVSFGTEGAIAEEAVKFIWPNL
jgi:hypothetical protein